jgi:oxygen-independent coproporphyrinogen-3 oxidase
LGAPLRLVSNGTTWIPAAGSVSAPVESLYVHVPFCAQKCEYCAFYSGPASGELIQRYVQALLRELELIAQDCRPKTVFFGGGTPSLLSLKQWESVLTTLHRLGLGNAPELPVRTSSLTDG